MTKSGAAREFFLIALRRETDDCVIWPFRRNNRGYGEVTIEGFKTKLAHRIMCHLMHGDPPTNKHHASHSCGRGGEGCINHRHLSWKTATENAQDKFVHGTQRYGENHQNAKLTTDEALKIKRSTLPRSALAVIYKTSVENVRDIQNGRRWKHLP